MGMARKTNVVPWPGAPEQIDPAMLDDIAARVSAAMPADKTRGQDYIRGLINKIIKERYREAKCQE